ncbi:MAG TPA: alpha-amylase family glycosyl hydrolase [Ktedonobacteraceae bacterium]|nr:alpha-amylase family glycosyl hydrolase [Ktedonobacteraceae bacterium]
MINLSEVGASATDITDAGVAVTFGVYLPGITQEAGYEVLVRVMHKDDRFVLDSQTLAFSLAPIAGSPNNLWQAKVTIPVVAGTHLGLAGSYIYHYQLLQTLAGSSTKQVVTNWFTDPFAQATYVGPLSAFATPGFIPEFVWTDGAWKTPELEQLIVYEMHVEEFNSTFDGVVERLPYLKNLGVTCLELMPVTSLKLDFDWGYGPLYYFAPNERWGDAQGLKGLINACHNAGIAVILDVVYQHVDPTFPYAMVYRNAGLPSPMIGGNGPFGPEIDFSKEFSRDYVKSVNFHWLNEYHVDGFRYDEVTDLYDGPAGVQYAEIAYETYNESLKIARFTPSGGTATGEYSRIIQCPEELNLPQEILKTTYSNATWQDALLDKAEDMATNHYVDDAFVHLLDTRFSGYPDTKTVHDIANNPVDMPVAPFQYFDSHDHSQLIAFFGTLPGDVPFGDRSKSYQLQPFAIALYTCAGIPMLWQGQEFADNYVLPNAGNGRICYRRDVHWEYYFDEFGAPLARLYQILGSLRHTYPALRSRECYYYNVQSRTQDGIVAYSRQSTPTEQIAIVVLNFSGVQQAISLPFPVTGTYREMIDNDVRQTPYDIVVSSANQDVTIGVPSNYGYVFVR